MASAPLLIAAASNEAFGASLPQKVVDVVNHALTLEYVETALYKEDHSASGLIPADYRQLFRTIRGHQPVHVLLLKSALGSAAVKVPKVDITSWQIC